MFQCRHFKGVTSFVRSFSRITLQERTPNVSLSILQLKTQTETSKACERLGLLRIQLRPSTDNLEIGDNIRRNPLIPLKEIIDIPLVTRIIESPVQRSGTDGPIGDNLRITPTIDLPGGIASQDENGKHAARLIVIRRRKMRKHKLRKLRKRMKFEWLKVRQRRELKKEKLFQAELLNQIKEAEKFSAEAYVASKLRQATEVPIPRFWKGKRLPQFIIKQKLGIE